MCTENHILFFIKNLIISSPPLFSSLSHVSLPIYDLFVQLFYTHTYTHVHKCILLNLFSVVCLYIISWLTSGYWINRYPILRKTNSTDLRLLKLFVCSSLSKYATLWDFFFTRSGIICHCPNSGLVWIIVQSYC